MTEEMTSAQKTERYETTLEHIRAGRIPDMDELQWFAETSLEFANTVGSIFSEAQQLARTAVAVLEAIADHHSPETLHPDTIAPLLALAVLTGQVDIDDTIPTTEVLQ